MSICITDEIVVNKDVFRIIAIEHGFQLFVTPNAFRRYWNQHNYSHSTNWLRALPWHM